MKRLYSAIPVIFLFLIGCSTTYNVTDYSSKKVFYEDVNSSIKNRDAKVVTFDSSFIVSAGSEIKDDSLQEIFNIQEKKISLKDVKEIKYFGGAYKVPSAYVWLKNGKELRTDNIKMLPDSMIQLANIKKISGYIPVDKIKEISYKTRWLGALTGIPLGLGSCAIVGGILGSQGVIFHINDGGMQDTFDKEQSTMVGVVLGALIGIITGAIAGYIIGWNNIYQFNP